MPDTTILGPAWPALLAPGLRVYLDGYASCGTLLHDPNDAPGDGWWVAWDADLLAGQPVDAVVLARPDWHADLRIDYADPHTRDRVCRALEAATGIPYRDTHPGVIRAGAAAVWGGE